MSGDVAVVAVCRECGGWVAVATEDGLAAHADLRRDFYKSVAKGNYRVETMPGDDFRGGKIAACKGSNILV